MSTAQEYGSDRVELPSSDDRLVLMDDDLLERMARAFALPVAPKCPRKGPTAKQRDIQRRVREESLEHSLTPCGVTGCGRRVPRVLLVRIGGTRHCPACVEVRRASVPEPVPVGRLAGMAIEYMERIGRMNAPEECP